MRLRSESGQAATENLAVIAVLVIAIIGATYTFVPTFSSGVDGLAKDVKYILATGKVGDLGVDRGSNDDGINDGSGPYNSRASRSPDSASGDEADSGAGGDDGDTQGGRGDGGGRLGGSAADSAASRQMAEGSSQGSDTTPISREKTDDPTAALPGGPGGMGAAVSP